MGSVISSAAEDGEENVSSADEVDYEEIQAFDSDAILRKINSFKNIDVHSGKIINNFQQLTINNSQFSLSERVIRSPVPESRLNPWERESSQILAWNPVWFIEYNEKSPEILPSLIMKGTIYKPNQLWDKRLKFKDYRLYRDRFHVLYRLELFQQILTGILTPPLSMFNAIKNKGQDNSKKSYGVSGGEFYINKDFGRRFVVERTCHFENMTDFGTKDLVLLCKNDKYENAIFGIVKEIKLRTKRQNIIRENQVVERYEITYRCNFTAINADRIFVKLVAPLISNSRQIFALEGLKSSPLLDSLLNPSLNCHSLRKACNVPESADLNDSQQRAVMRIVDDMNYCPEIARIALVHGPPGTGKSTTILHLVKSLMAQTCHKGQILVCAASNAAVDSVAVKLIKSNVQFTRVGSLLISPQVINHSLTEQFNSQQKYNSTVLFLSNQDVILSTLSSCGSEAMRLGVTPNIIILDEASQASELDLNIALQLGCAKKKIGCKKLVLVGDHNQLPPTVLSKPAEKRHLDLSLFDRCRLNLETQNAKDKMMLLNTQYRMVEPIAHFPSKYVYENKIITPKPGTPGFRANPPDFPLLPYKFIDTGKYCGTEVNQFDSPSLINKTEATHILRVCQEIISCARLIRDVKEFSRELGKKEKQSGEKGEESWGKQEDIGVISFYKAQVGYIKKVLIQNGLRGIEVNTVDGFQGREKQIIIVSCVRTNLNTVGFLGIDYRRMNVAITRAKLGLYIIGCANSLKRSKDWRSLIESAEERQYFFRCDANNFPRVANIEIMKRMKKKKFVLQEMVKQNKLQRISRLKKCLENEKIKGKHMNSKNNKINKEQKAVNNKSLEGEAQLHDVKAKSRNKKRKKNRKATLSIDACDN